MLRLHRVTLCLAALLLAAAAGTAQQGRQLFPEERPQLELFTGLLFGSGDVEEDFGLRATTRRYKRWAFELGGRRFGPGSLDLWIVDASAKLYLGRGQRLSYYGLAGPGYLFSGRQSSDGTLLMHVGLGVDITLTNHLFLRPDLRGRWFLENSSAPPVGELTLGLGWRP